MEHLSAETLARLVDEAPEPEELEHLERCPRCTGEIEALKEQAEGLGRLTALRPPLDDWEVLEARLVSEGLIKQGRPWSTGLAMTPGWMRGAAAVLLFLCGGGFGAGVARHTANPPGEQSLTPAFTRLASQVSSSQDAAELVRLTERHYMEALLRYRQLAEVEGGDELLVNPESRFAALEYLVAAGQAAVRQAPADPFLNGVLASALAERQAVLRRISTGSADNWF